MKHLFPLQVPAARPSSAILLLVTQCVCFFYLPLAANAQTVPITSSGLNTQVSPPTTLPGGQTQYNITGGTRPSGGGNLFHSFGEFGVPTNNIANFLNDSGLSTSNILGRITGGNVSSIFGMIQTTGFEGANLFLMNPAGFLFGPNAAVSIGGMMTFTTADYLRFQGTETLFNNASTPESLSPLSIAPVAAFGFLGPNPAAINFEGGQLTVAEGTGLALVGGNINLQPDASGTPSSITAPGRPILLTSVAGPGEVAADTGIPAAGMALGTITLGEGTVLSTAGDPSFSDGSGGAVSIRGGQFIATGTNILTNFASGTIGHGGDITIVTTGSAGLTDSTIDTRTIDPQSALVKGGDAGAVTMTASDLTLTTSSILTGVNILTSAPATLSTGEGGAVTLTGSDSVTLTQTVINTGTQNSNGNGGAITVIAPTVALENSVITTEVRGPLTKTAGGGSVVLGGPRTNNVSMTSSRIVTDSFETEGNAGSVMITGQTVTIGGDGFGGPTITTSTHHDPFTGPFPTSGNAGDIQISGTDVTFANATFLGSVADSPGTSSRGGNISVHGSESILVDSGTSFTTTTASNGNAGNIQLTSPHVTITGGSQIGSNTEGGGGNSGLITVTGTENIAIDSGSLITTVAGPDSQGSAGEIVLNTPDLAITGGSAVANQNFGAGAGGTVTLQGINGPAQSVLISDGSIIFTNTDIGTGPGSSIFVNARSFALQNSSTMFAGTNAAGNGGSILVKADSASITGGSQISSSSVIGDSGTIPTGNAGTVTIEGTASPALSILIDGFGSGIFTDTQGTGAGGNIFVNANSVTLSNGSTLSATTSGTEVTATGGTITVDANQVMLETQSFLTASTIGAGQGGTIVVTADTGVSLLGNSSITSTADATGGGGFVQLTAPTITLEGSELGPSNIVTSTRGEGNAGNIELNATELSLAQSFISARTEGPGQAGSITIQGQGGSGTNASDVTLSGSQLVTETIGDGVTTQGNAGSILIKTARLSLKDVSQLNTASRGSTGIAGNIILNAMEQFIISSSIVNSDSIEAATGSAGQIFITSPSVLIENNGSVSTSTEFTGNAGNITVNTNSLQITSGGKIASSSTNVVTEFLNEFPELAEFFPITGPAGKAGTVTVQGLGSRAESVLVDGVGSGIFTETKAEGEGGNIFVNANSVTLQNGGTLSVATSGNEASATGGTITVNAGQVQVNSGGLLTASTTGAGAGGSINISGNTFAINGGTVSSSATQAAGGDITILTGQSVTLNNGSLITASSNGAGNAGNIVINAGQQYTSTNSSVTTKADTASGGNITVLATGLVQLTNSELNASVQGSSTTVGGNILIDPLYVILQNSKIVATATQGQGGNINIFYTGAFLADPSTVIDASSQFGQSGTVTIQSPISPASGKIIPIGQKPLIATSLLSQRCAALAGGNISSFTVAGRDTLPSEPGDWLSTPVALAAPGPGVAQEAKGEGDGSHQIDEIDQTNQTNEFPLLSLRQIAPLGFLIQTFAIDDTDCRS